MAKKLLVFILQVAALISFGCFLLSGFDIAQRIVSHHNVPGIYISVTMLFLVVGVVIHQLAKILKQSNWNAKIPGEDFVRKLDTPWKRSFFLITFVLFILWVASWFYVNFKWNLIEYYYIFGAYHRIDWGWKHFFYGLFSWVWYLFPMSLFLFFFGEKLLSWIKKGN